MKKLIFILILMIPCLAYGQEYKESVSVVQFSAEFTKDAEIDLKKLKDCKVYTFYIEKDKEVFINESILYLPSLLVFQNGKEMLRIETGISMKFEEDAEQKIKDKVEELVSSKF